MSAPDRLRRVLAVAALAAALSAAPGVVGAQSAEPVSPSPGASPGASPEAATGTPAPEASTGAATGTPDARPGIPLEGTTWRLERYRFRDDVRPVGPEVAAWVTLRAGRVRGAGGCGPIRGSYGRMGDALAIRLRSRERSDCPEQSGMVERSLRRALERAATFELATADVGAGLEDATTPAAEDSPTQLVLYDSSDDELLRFGVDDVAELEVGEWRLEAYTQAGERVGAVGEPQAVLTLRPGERDALRRRTAGEVIGSTGCNGFVGTYTRAADVLDLADLELSDAPCSDALERQETTMLGVLEAHGIILDLPPDRLVLTDPESGDSLELVTARPLEGSTWLLADLSNGQVVPDVTMHLEGGVIGGEGPCGPYAGSYETDGVFIRIRDVAGEGLPCELARNEAALIDALERAVLVERPRGRLRLRDAAGRDLARFDAATAP